MPIPCRGGEQRFDGSLLQWLNGKARSSPGGRCVFSSPSLRASQTIGGGRAQYCRFRVFTGACPVTLARHVLCAYFDAWHAHVLSRVPSRILLLWVR